MTSENNKKPYVPEFKQLMRSSRLIKSRLITQTSNLKDESKKDEHLEESEEIKKTGKLKFSRKAEEQAMLLGGQLSVCDSFERLMNGETVMLDLPIGKHILKYNLAQASGTQEINIIKDKTLNIEASIGGLITPKIIFDIKYTS